LSTKQDSPLWTYFSNGITLRDSLHWN